MTTKVSKSLTRQPRAPSEHRDGRQHLHDPLRPQSHHLPRSHGNGTRSRTQRGCPRIFEEMKAAGLPEPKIVEATTNVTVVLYNGKTAANNAQTTENTTQKTTESTTQKTTEKIIRILKERPYATAGQLAEELGLTIDGVDYNIRKLKKQGRIVRIGGDKGGHWEIHEK